MAAAVLGCLAARVGGRWGCAAVATFDVALEDGDELIHQAVTARRPRTRYAVGTDAKLLVPLARFLPDRAKDAIFGRLVGL